MFFSNESGTISIGKRISRAILGNPKNINDPGIFNKIALIPFFAWIGLGADGLSSSAYGPEEAFRTLGIHSYLSVFLVLATILTVTVISYAYSKIIEHFPNGGGGYVVATSLIGKKAGVISGSALIIDYILTVTVSIVSCSDAMFSYLPYQYHKYKIIAAGIMIFVLVIMNLRGTKESIKILAPIFILFIVSHIFLIGYGLISHYDHFNLMYDSIRTNGSNDISSIGYIGIFLILIRAYSLGGGTYTGIEAVSNGLQIMRSPKVKTGKRTMLYMALSLSIAAGGLFLCYELVGVEFVQGKTLNSVLADTLFGHWQIGYLLAFITILSEGALLFVAAQAGFIDAPRVMANMALDMWLPRKFAALSERLTMRNGIMIIGSFALLLLIYTEGSISALVVMYSINVFLTFTISQFAMVRFYFNRRKVDKYWIKHIFIFCIGFVLCSTILIIILFEKFAEGGWITILITTLLICLCFLIRNHYENVKNDMKILEENLPVLDEFYLKELPAINKYDRTAVQLVGNYDGFGIHTLFSILKSFPGLYKNFIFVSIIIVDHELFKENESIDDLMKQRIIALKKYIKLCKKMGLNAEYRIKTSTNIIECATDMCIEISQEYKNITVFTGKLSFNVEKFFHKYLHNDTSYSLQRNLQLNGITNVILPICIKN